MIHDIVGVVKAEIELALGLAPVVGATLGDIFGFGATQDEHGAAPCGQAFQRIECHGMIDLCRLPDADRKHLRSPSLRHCPEGRVHDDGVGFGDERAGQ